MVVVLLTLKIVHELICLVLRFNWNISMGSKIKMQRGEIRIIYFIFQSKIIKKTITVKFRD